MTKGQQLLSDSKFFEAYSRYLDDLGRYETWDEAVERVMEMHKEFYKDKLTGELKELFDEVESAYKDKLFLGAQRALQFGGKQLFTHHARLYNCFSESTQFVTSGGVKAFSDFSENDICYVPTHTGKWQKAIVKSYGKQQLNIVTFKKGSSTFSVKVTDNHRWLLKDGTETTSLKIGDKVQTAQDSFKLFNWDEASDIEQLYWLYGFVYGDGTVGTNGYSKVRLCGADRKYEYRFIEHGFSSSSSASLKGDIIISTGSYKKTAPDPNIDSIELIRAFVAGYLSADGEKNNVKGGKQYRSIQSSEKEHIEFIRKCFPLAGVYILNETDLTGKKTNYGVRPYTIKFSLYEGVREVQDKSWIVESIVSDSIETVWCLEVENDASFTLSNGIITGNCASTYCDRPEVFGETMYMLLCGAGVGFSVQKQHVNKLPNIQKRNKSAKTFIIPDSIEGWAEAIDVLLSSFFVGGGKFPDYEGRKIYFDFSKIRPKNAFISGGFKAPGSEPLQKALTKIELLIKSELDKDVNRLKPIIVYDIIMHLADAVISGGVRRSATICMFSKDDEDMINAKTGDWYITNPQRGRSNNSVMLLRNEVTFDEFSKIMESVKHSGEPGFIFVDDLSFTLNPCVTSDTSIMTDKGAKLVKDLIGVQFKAIVNGKSYQTTEKGFWETGVKQTYKLELTDGSYVKLTDNHKVLTTNGWKEVKELEKDDLICLHNHENLAWESTDTTNKEVGWLLGNLVGDGTFDKNSAILRYWNEDTYLLEQAKQYLTKNCKLTKDFTASNDKKIVQVHSSKLKDIASYYGILPLDKTPNDLLEETSSSFYEGYLQGLFDADGSVVGSAKKGGSIRLSQNNLELLQQVQRMLLRLGIKSTIYQNRRAEGYYELPDGNGGYSEYFCKSIHELVISKSSMSKYRDRVGFSCKAKRDTLNKLLDSYKTNPYEDKFYSSIKSITLADVEKVYDVTVPIVEAFDANGIYVHNCVEVGMRPISPSGESGFQVCNLTEINGSKSISEDIFLHQCKVASIMGTLQAGYTDFKYLSKATKDIVDREALIGVGITGFMNNPKILFDENILKKGAEVVKYWNKIVAKIIGIRQASRTTVVKPSNCQAA